MNDTTACRRCGQIGGHIEAEAKPPHYKRLDCGSGCGFIAFLRKPDGRRYREQGPDEWVWSHPIRRRMRTQEPTEKQLDRIKNGPEPYCYVEPVNRDEASMVVGMIVGGSEGTR